MANSDDGELNNSNLASNSSDPNNSLLKKVTKRVSGLFPSSLTKWFNPNEGQQSTIRRRESFDEDDEQLQIQQPPKKKSKPAYDLEFSAPNSFHQTTSTPLLNSRDLQYLQPGPSGFTRTPKYDGDATRTEQVTRNHTTVTHTVVNGDDKSDSGDSTSGYSSVLAQQHKESSFISDRGNAMISQPSTSKMSSTPSPNKSLNTSLNSSRSLFSDQSLNPQRQCLSSRRPSFSASTFGSPSFVDRTLSTKNAINSPFYGGRTTYGGASAYKRSRIIFPRDQGNNLQVKNSINIKPVNETTSNSDNACLSKTARRILDALEHFSTPVVDARKIPNINRQSQINKNRQTPYARDLNKSNIVNRELIIPTVPDLLKMKLKERLQDSTVQVRKVATTSKSVLNSEYSIRTIEDETTSKPLKHTNKIKSRIDTLETVDSVKLPDVKLPITTLPKFDFTVLPPASATVKPPETITKPNKTNITIISNIDVTPKSINSSEYSFAKPIIVSEIPKSITSINNFKFSEPIDAKSLTSPIKKQKQQSTTPAFTFKSNDINTAPKRKDPVKNNGQNDTFALQPPKELVQGSVMDILGKNDKKFDLLDKFKPPIGTWECSACMVRNIPSATRCVACETTKEPPKKVEKPPSFGNQFKMSTDKWECSACLVRNNNSDVKCVACTTPKPGASPAAVAKPAVNSFQSSFGDKFKPASGTWECDACMVRNKSEDTKCVACETPKPGTKSESANKPSLIMPVEVKTTNSGFADLIKKQQVNWECPSCMVRNPPEKKTCTCCEASKPGEQKEFTFGAPAGLQFKFGIDKSSTPSASSSTTSISSGFTFAVATTVATTFSFGVKTTSVTTTTTLASTSSTELQKSVPEFKFGVPTVVKKTEETAAIVSTPSKITFGIIATTTTDSNKTNAASTSINTTAASSSTSSLPVFSFGVPTTPSVIPSDNKAVTVKANDQNIFGTNCVTTPSKIPEIVKETNKPTFGTTNKETTTFGTEKPASSLSVPQFNFGSGGLPFSPVFTKKTEAAPAATTTTASISFGNAATFTNTNTNQNKSESTPAFGGTNAPALFSFKSTTPATTNNNKTASKSFTFGGTTTTTSSTTPANEPAVKNDFIFNPDDAQKTTAPLSKAPIFNFAGSSSNDAPKPNVMFNFGANKTTENKTPSFGNSTMFGTNNQQSSTPQNGGFNFGSTTITPNFNFGGATSSATPAMFGFGSSQAGSGSVATAAPAASAPGIFTFGGGASAQQQPTSAFSPDIKPNFNFTGGSVTTFTGQGGASAGMPQRKIRRAVRRTQR